jgi:ABC-type transporter Mla subunit MlaD
MTEAQRLVPGDPVTDLNARIGIIGQRQEELAQLVGKLDDSVGDFSQLRTYVEQIAQILADVAKEVAAHDVSLLERRLDKLAEAVGEAGKLRDEVGQLQDEVGAAAELAGELARRPETRRAV